MKAHKNLSIGIIGYGKMGKAVEGVAKDRGHDVTVIINGPGAPSRISDQVGKVDVFIEFTSGNVAFGNISACVSSGIPVVSGSTGWIERMPDIRQLVEKHHGAFFYASNFSVGVHLFMKTAAYLSSLMNEREEYDVMMEETHHIHKKDAPSGTALSLADNVIEHLDRKQEWTMDSHGHSPEQIPVVAKRIGMEFGHHKLIFHSEIDTISIEHRAFSRLGFATGAVLAAEFLAGKQGYFGMEDLLG